MAATAPPTRATAVRARCWTALCGAPPSGSARSSRRGPLATSRSCAPAPTCAASARPRRARHPRRPPPQPMRTPPTPRAPRTPTPQTHAPSRCPAPPGEKSAPPFAERRARSFRPGRAPRTTTPSASAAGWTSSTRRSTRTSPPRAGRTTAGRGPTRTPRRPGRGKAPARLPRAPTTICRRPCASCAGSRPSRSPTAPGSPASACLWHRRALPPATRTIPPRRLLA